MRKTHFPTAILFICMLLQAGVAPLTAWGQSKQGTTKGDLTSNLSLLELWEQPSEATRQLYETAYKLLAAHPHTTFAQLAQDSDFQHVCQRYNITHLGGPMLGTVSSTGANVWLRTTRPAAVAVIVDTDGREQRFGPVNTTAASDLTAVVRVTGLKPGTRHTYQVMVNDKPIRVPDHASIVTAPESSLTGNVRIAFGSCFHRWGLGNQAQAKIIRERAPAAMLLIGDVAVQDRKNHLGLHRADYLLRDSFTAWRDLVATIPVYATWDDHDYFANDKAGVPKGYTDEDRIGIRRVFQQAWNNPAYGFDALQRGIFLRTRMGPCDIIMVDNRFFRTGTKGSFLGDQQMQWLSDQLLDCQGPFIILSCGTMWSDYVSNGKDSWGRWDPEGRERIFKLIEQHRIGGVLLISGDRHGARGFQIPRPSGFHFHEFEAGSLGGRKGPPVTRPDWEESQLYGMAGKYAFGEFSIDADLPDPEVVFRLIGDDGSVIHQEKLTLSQLTPPQPSESAQ